MPRKKHEERREESDRTFRKTQILNVSPTPYYGRAFRPVNQRIAARLAKVLYDMESKRSHYIERCADEWLEFNGFGDGTRFTSEEKWFRGIPQALYDCLESFEPDSAVAAAAAFLESKGHKVTFKE